jgi:hypothetical protein
MNNSSSITPKGTLTTQNIWCVQYLSMHAWVFTKEDLIIEEFVAKFVVQVGPILLNLRFVIVSSLSEVHGNNFQHIHTTQNILNLKIAKVDDKSMSN